MRRIIIFGNAGSGKSTMARRLATEGLSHLDLDDLAWSSPRVRKSIAETAIGIDAFIAAHDDWVIEGCYADLLEIAARHATEARFLNPGADACIANCRARPWEPHKFESKQAQDELLEFLIAWVRQYYTRTDECSLVRHRALFDAFTGEKHEL